jgi:WD40 repeat protein
LLAPSAIAQELIAQELLPTAGTEPRPPDKTAKVDLGLYSLAWSPDGQRLAVGGRGSVRIYQMPDFVEERTFNTDQQEIWALAWARDNSTLATAGKDGTVQLWRDGALQKKFVQGAWIFDLSWKPDGSSLLAADYSGLAKEWDMGGFLRAAIQLDGDGLAIDWSPDGRFFAVGTGHDGSRLLLFDSVSAELKWRRQDIPKTYRPPFGYGRDEVNGVRYSPDAKWIATALQDGRVVVRSAETGEIAYQAQLHGAGIEGTRRVAWSPRGDWIASCGEDGRVNCVQFPDGKERWALLESERAVWSVGWSPDGRWIAAVGEEGNVWIWSTDFLPAPPSPAPAIAPSTKPKSPSHVGSHNSRKHYASRKPVKKTLWNWLRGLFR